MSKNSNDIRSSETNHFQKVGDKIKALRLKHKMSQRGFGDRTGVHFTQLVRYENGRVLPSAKVLNRICESMEIPTSYFAEELIFMEKGSIENEKLTEIAKAIDLMKGLPTKEIKQINKLMAMDAI
ncbi:MAG: helix-turn-helix transcriptional regulator [Bacteroidota bacterium]